jgi:hypothetical protein
MEQEAAAQNIRITTPKPGAGPKLKDEPPPPPLEPEQAKERFLFIRENIALVERLRDEGKTFDEMKDAASDFANNYPHLFIMVSSKDGYNKEMLASMLKMMDNMGKANISQHDASIKVGTNLMKNFIKKA